MSKFVVVKRIDLSDMGEGWNECYVEIEALTVNELQKWSKFKENDTDEFVEIIKSKFIGGEGFNGKEVIEMTKQDVGEMPLDILLKIVDGLTKKKVEN